MSTYEELRSRHAADAAAALPEMLARLDWPADRLAEHRTAELRRLVRVARDLSPWHRKRLAEVHPDEIDEATLAQLPVMTKDDLMEHFDEIVTDERLRRSVVEDHLDALAAGGSPYLFDRYQACASGGSSGVRGVFVYDWPGLVTAYWSCLRHLFRAARVDPAQASAPQRPVMVAAGAPTHVTASWLRTFAGPQLPWRFAPATLPVAQRVALLNEVRPTTLAGYPTALHELAREAQAGRLRIRPVQLVATGEPLLPEVRTELERTFGANVGNAYATSEAGGLATLCGRPESPWLHLAEDTTIVEPVDAAGARVGPGVCSDKIFLTNLYNHALPLIRYEVTDQVTVLDGACGCGCAHRRIADPLGRLDDVFDYGGVTVHPHVFRAALSRHREILEYQVRQTPTGASVAARCTGALDTAGVAGEIAAALGRVGVPDARVEVTPVERIERPASGKLVRFVPLRGA
ncbi:MAG: phenylacetate--CoA ligase family protein [Actinomycetia bacterium]|nr:phenylacetate--CoA ligase family protein [Actinomycetes bacterium]